MTRCARTEDMLSLSASSNDSNEIHPRRPDLIFCMLLEVLSSRKSWLKEQPQVDHIEMSLISHRIICCIRIEELYNDLGSSNPINDPKNRLSSGCNVCALQMLKWLYQIIEYNFECALYYLRSSISFASNYQS